MKIESFGGFIKREQMPASTRNTQVLQHAVSVLDKVKSCPVGQACAYPITGAKGSEAASLQRRLRLMGVKVQVSLSKDLKTLYVYRMTDEEWTALLNKAKQIRKPKVKK